MYYGNYTKIKKPDTLEETVRVIGENIMALEAAQEVLKDRRIEGTTEYIIKDDEGDMGYMTIGIKFQAED